MGLWRPVGRFAFLVVALLDHAQSPCCALYTRCIPVHRMVATVDAPIVVRPLLRLSVIVVSHKNKESPQLSPRTLLGSSFLIFFRKASLQLMYSFADCSRQLSHAARLADRPVHSHANRACKRQRLHADFAQSSLRAFSAFSLIEFQFVHFPHGLVPLSAVFRFPALHP